MVPGNQHPKGHKEPQKRESNGVPQRASSAARPLDRSQLEMKALAYLERFDATRSKLGSVLTQFVRKRCLELGADEAPHLQAVHELLDRYTQNGLIDDHRFAASLGRTLRERGASRVQIQHRLAARGVPSDVIGQVLGGLAEAGTSELSAAEALVKKRRLGHFRPPESRRDNFQRDLGILARAGFDFETATRALQVDADRNEFEP